jgi:hypothetical protein
MLWLNLQTSIIRTPEYVGSDPVVRATWFNLLVYCAEQENDGVIQNCEAWKCRQWQQTCGVMLEEVQAESALWEWNDGSLIVNLYPSSKQSEVQNNREAGTQGGRKTSQAKAEAARLNGSKGGRPKSQAETEANPSTTEAEKPNNQSDNPTEGNGREWKGMEGNSPKPPEGAEGVLALTLDVEGQDQPRDEYAPDFAAFWNAYPRKKSKGDAWKVWQRLKCKSLLQQILTAVKVQRQTHDWTKDNGQFIPYPASWLNDRAWEDDVVGAVTSGEYDFGQDAKNTPIDFAANFAETRRLRERRERILGGEIEPETDEERALVYAD